MWTLRENSGIIVLNKRTARGVQTQRRSNDQEGISFMDATSDITTQLKQCTKCKQAFPATTEYFAVEKRVKSGLFSWCRLCAAEWQREYRKNNPDRVRDTERKRNAKPERRGSQNTSAKQRYHNDPKHLIKQQAKNANHRAKRYGAMGKCTAEIIQSQYSSQRGRCWWCSKDLNNTFDVDHRIPFSKGGTNLPENIVVTCEFCNSSKNNRLSMEWNGRLL